MQLETFIAAMRTDPDLAGLRVEVYEASAAGNGAMVELGPSADGRFPARTTGPLDRQLLAAALTASGGYLFRGPFTDGPEADAALAASAGRLLVAALFEKDPPGLAVGCLAMAGLDGVVVYPQDPERVVETLRPARG